ncbi:aminotransferase [Halorhodospira abdelmalekii]|uniref:aminotransferase class V-fold PLP-dependent enzyme n=1 Tax=Halorhodospira abdelmalekii TaxID=421629 RepID=UPI001904584B|nr:aminotransferase class V-fold PLP-dependent enzyme [Halorhodospira abdelmalekii]MBK1734639.1 aminotransferase [Halorhodospira abdelmalekii]
MSIRRHPQFPQEPDRVYLNHAGVGPWPLRAGEAVQRFASECVTRGSADYPAWLEVEARLRQRLARLFGGVASTDIALVPNTSAGLSLLAYGLPWQPGDEIVINDQEFPSNRWVWESLAPRFGVTIRRVCLDDGPTPEDALIAALSARTRLLPVSSVQYGTGLRMDLERLGAACRERGVLLCVDAIQSLGALRFAIDADCVVADGHKWMLGPEGLGALYLRPELRERLQLNQFGWHMVESLGDFSAAAWQPAASARRFEPGSPNLLAAHALEASLAVLEESGPCEVEEAVLKHARWNMEAARRRGYPLVTPQREDRHAGIVTFQVPLHDPLKLLDALRRAGVACAERCGGIRFSAHFYHAEEELELAWALLDECIGAAS